MRNGYEFDEEEMPQDTQMNGVPRPPGAGGPKPPMPGAAPGGAPMMQSGGPMASRPPMQQQPGQAPMSTAPKPPMPAGAATGQGGAGASPPSPSPQGGVEQDDRVAQVLWERANQMQPQDMQALGRVMNREAGLILLKLVPELAPIFLEMPQMQGPEMQEIRQQFGHDEFMGQMRGRQQQPQPSNVPGAMPPTRRSADGLRSI